MVRSRYFVVAALLTAAWMPASLATAGAPDAAAVGLGPASAAPPLIKVQAQTNASAATSEQPAQPRRRFWGPILGSMERAANPAPQANPAPAATTVARTTTACTQGKVGTWDPAARRYVYKPSGVCQ